MNACVRLFAFTLFAGLSFAQSVTVTGVSPAVGPTGGGNKVSIQGTNFVSGCTVKFGSIASTSVTFVSATQLTAVVPAQSLAGAVTVTVTNSDGGTGSLANGYTYSVKPVIWSISPSVGPATGGTAVTILGA